MASNKWEYIINSRYQSQGGHIMRKSISYPLFIVILMVLLITGCSSKSYNTGSRSEPMYDMAVPQESMEESEIDYDNVAVEEELGLGTDITKRKTGQKLIYRASMNIEVLGKLDPLITSIQNFVDNHDGYIENMEQFRNGYDPITQEELEAIFMTIRIPHEHYNKTLQTIAELGTVVNKSSRTEDVTLQYSDIESTLRMYKVEQDRLLEMLENETTDVKDMIEIEKRLSEVRVELERQESARRSLDSLINYDTIELEMHQVRRTSEEGQQSKFTDRIKSAFRDSIDSVIIFAQGLILALTYLALPLMILVFIFGTVAIVAIKIVKRKKRKTGKVNTEDENNAD